ncbi:hypothetical protein ACS0TY_002703 [Phlomoides rotata]
MSQSCAKDGEFDFDSITTRVRHLRENIAELQRNYDQLTLNVKVSGNVNLDTVQTSINGIKYVQHLLWQALECPLLKIGSPSVTQKERVQQAEPQQVFQVPELGKYPQLWALKGVNPNDVRRWYEFGALASICTIAPNFQEISELPDWVLNAVVESWHNNPHLKRGDEPDIKFITVSSEDTTNAIQYPSFHFMKLQRPNKKAFTYIKEQETKP